MKLPLIISGPKGNCKMDSIYRHLLDVGVQPKLSGFSFLHDAIAISIERPWLSLSEMCRQMAREKGCDARQIEKNMRHAVHKAFDKLDDETIQRYFGATANKFNAPSAPTFIATMALHCRDTE